ncbi:Alcohol dehydrogenase zinc-binding domain-containing protein [Acidipropionibacterium acidipropionici ATCC 4875]|uniref:Alcohol dehydrogenase zinc-binding domain-containing protein n=1 Tax=Acidipropionibacterium acidipropionici (strain ATCC 4875 / DSM 20272 / JCM 6432 / NBRC 12425 / NCIMB 8070 / 4) TaxID=1171373 RepID=K7S0I6_ACIA4|nr:NAD(P)-dependent alcohol dehydrogenase [Acidipropionibacterium acidipropionici]AFV90823.1 Alcohol dehydrogenase zinc-binding domain-containing protein [Acidipropionibacterium acidipropionici ATCC 4875]
MFTYRFDHLDGLDSLTRHEEESPSPQRGEVLVRVRSVALNYRDIAIPLGRYVWDARPGLIPCSDAAGEIVETGDGVDSFEPGDRVVSCFHSRWFGGRPPANLMLDTYGSGKDGWLTQYAVVSQDAVVKIGDELSFGEASTLPCAGVTAWNALSGPSPIRPGDTVLTQGSGGVSIFAIQLAKALGASVIATTTSADKEALLRDLGADRTINTRDTPEWGGVVRDMTGDGVDRIVEVVGPQTIHQSLAAIRWNSEIVLVGFLSSTGPDINYFTLKGSGASIRSIGVGDRTMLEELIRVVAAAGIRPVIDSTYSFNEAPQAFRHLADGRHTGKIVIELT